MLPSRTYHGEYLAIASRKTCKDDIRQNVVLNAAKDSGVTRDEESLLKRPLGVLELAGSGSLVWPPLRLGWRMRQLPKKSGPSMQIRRPAVAG